MQTSDPYSSARTRRNLDWLAGAALFGLTLVIYLRTLAPTVAYMFDDSLEFQLLASRMAIAHPTGYPLYSILIKLATFLPFGDVAYRVNLVSAVSASGTVLFVYLAARLLTERFFRANNVIGAILTRMPALIAALVLAFGETFWSQAVLAEVYSLQALFTAVMLWLVLEWGAARRRQEAEGAGQGSAIGRQYGRVPSLLVIAFFAGLLLTHHRMSVLLYPALVVYVLSYERAFLRKPLTLLKLALAFVIPLVLYLYIPLRGTVTSSLDGAYQNTPEGFFNWILGTAYTVFVTQNPFNETRDGAYYLGLFVNDFGALGILAVVFGFVALFLRAWREWVLLALALAANLAFVLTYRVADINVFFIPSFVIVSLFLAAGLAGLLWLAYYTLSNRVATTAAGLGAIVLLLVPIALFRDHYARVDLSNKYDVIDYGRSILAQRLPENATIIGILGEMSLLRYLEIESYQPNVETIAADKEADRLKASEDALKRGRDVYLTRPLRGIEKEYALTSSGALVRVQPKPNRDQPPKPANPLDANFGDVKLLGYEANANYEQAVDGPINPLRFVRVTLYWQPQKKINDSRLVSLKLLDADGKRAAQLDRQPVLDAYPTNAWRNKEYITDTYDVPIFVGAAPGEYTLQLTLYDPATGQVVGQRELEQVRVSEQTASVPRELLGVNTTVLRDVEGVELSGYDLDVSDPFPRGSGIPLTLLWRMPGNGAARDYELVLTDEFGKVVQTQAGTVGEGDVRAGQYVRQELEVSLPTTLAAGKYILGLKVHAGLALPFQPDSITLGRLEVQTP